MSLVALEIQTFNVSITTERCLTKYFKFWQHLPKDILYIRTLYVWLLQQSSRHLLHHWHSILKSPEMREDEKSINIIFSLNEAVGALAEALRIFKVSDKNVICFIWFSNSRSTMSTFSTSSPGPPSECPAMSSLLRYFSVETQCQSWRLWLPDWF